jgi:hypothetical protein
LTLEGGIERWTFFLSPSDAKMATIVQQIRIAASRNNVLSIDAIQTDGDHSLMTIDRVASR